MKYTLLLLAAMISFAFNLPINPDSLLGEWQMYKLETPNGDVLERDFKILEFQNNGVVLNKKGDNINKATWSYDKKNNQISIVNANNSTELVNVLELTENTMVVDCREGKISLSRIK